MPQPLLFMIIILYQIHYRYFMILLLLISTPNAYYLDDVLHSFLMLPNHIQSPISIPFFHISSIVLTLYICNQDPHKSPNSLYNQTHYESQMVNLHIVILSIFSISLTLLHDPSKIYLKFLILAMAVVLLENILPCIELPKDHLFLFVLYPSGNSNLHNE